MLYDSPHVRVAADDGVATLWLHFPGPAINLLTAERMAEIGRAVRVVEATPGIEILVLRSAHPAGFCGGFDHSALRSLTTDSAAAEFAAVGQRVSKQIADSPLVTLAFTHGPVIGPGLELALACDHRLSVGGPDSWLGFGDVPTCWGGRTRLAALVGSRTAERFVGRTFAAREAAALGVVDRACCERRGTIELRTSLDRLQFAPKKRRPGWRALFANDAGDAAERQRFRYAVRAGLALPPRAPEFDTLNPVQPLATAGLVGDGERLRRLAVEFALRGVKVILASNSCDAKRLFAEAVARGRVTPLEAEQAAARITIGGDAEAVTSAELVVLDDTASDAAGHLERDLPPRAVLAVPFADVHQVVELAHRPHRVVGLALGDSPRVAEHDDTSPDTLAAVFAWLGGAGAIPQLTPLPVSPRAFAAV